MKPKKIKTLRINKGSVSSADRRPTVFHIAQHELDSATKHRIHNQHIHHKILRDLNIAEQNQPAFATATAGKPATIKHLVAIQQQQSRHSPHILDLRAQKQKRAMYEQKKEEVKQFIAQHKKSRAPILTLKKRKIKQHRDYSDQFTTSFQSNLISIYNLAPRLVVLGLAFCLLVILPFYGFAYYQKLSATRADLTALSKTTYDEFLAAADSLLSNPANGGASTAREQFVKASNNLIKIDQQFNSINSLIKLIGSASGSMADAQKVVTASEDLSLIGIQLSKAISDFYSTTNNKSLIEKLQFITARTKKILPLVTDANALLAEISPDFVVSTINDANSRDAAVPRLYPEKFDQLRAGLISAESILTDINASADYLIDALGKNHKQRYLIVFQNNNELRPTGGFIGSFALVEIDKGKIANINIPSGGSYALQGSITESFTAPHPLQLIQPRFEFQDSNWFPDFPTSAKKMAWFLEEANWPTVDAVIAINATWAAKLVDFVGPISLPDYKTAFTGANFVDELQTITLDKANKAAPKEIINELAAKLLETLPQIGETKLLPLANLIKQGLNEKEILLYFQDEDFQKILNKYNWTGQMQTTDSDYLQIVNTNIGGEKTDAFIQQKANLLVEITAAGEIINTLTISRTNPINGKANNVDYLRVYVPDGSKLLSATGTFEPPKPNEFEPTQPQWRTDSLINDSEKQQYIDPNTQTIITREFSKTVFANWLQTKPGETTFATFKYKLPQKFSFDKKTLNFFERQYKTAASGTATYSLLLQKQPGQQNNSVTVKINIPDGIKIINSNIPVGGLQTTLSQDTTLSVIASE
ncbi:DUF4012 domain-containing protein [Candidatus Falkowbacteria bacterium]|nr:DUF4012 domain-containing protein [Candidatus Falkowbacteria bacterium]